jgi:hypothetical protein
VQPWPGMFHQASAPTEVVHHGGEAGSSVSSQVRHTICEYAKFLLQIIAFQDHELCILGSPDPPEFRGGLHVPD